MPEQIRVALGIARLPSVMGFGNKLITSSTKTVALEDVVRTQTQLQQSTEALDWLQSRGFTPEMVSHYRIGLASWRNEHPAIALHIPTHQADQFYRKLRIAPWQAAADLPKWSQYGVPATIFQTYAPEGATATWFCEGEWDAMRLGWLAHQQNAKVVVCCSTAGCGSLPPMDQLNALPGDIVIWFDRNDTPTKNGLVPGDEGAKKLAQALGQRARIAQVPMPANCAIHGWDISNALDAGFSWADFEQAAQSVAVVSPPPSLKEQLTELLEEHPSPFEQSVELMNLSKQVDRKSVV